MGALQSNLHRYRVLLLHDSVHLLRMLLLEDHRQLHLLLLLRLSLRPDLCFQLLAIPPDLLVHLLFLLGLLLLADLLLPLDPCFVGVLSTQRHLLGDIHAVRDVFQLRRTVDQDLLVGHTRVEPGAVGIHVLVELVAALDALIKIPVEPVAVLLELPQDLLVVFFLQLVKAPQLLLRDVDLARKADVSELSEALLDVLRRRVLRQIDRRLLLGFRRAVVRRLRFLHRPDALKLHLRPDPVALLLHALG